MVICLSNCQTVSDIVNDTVDYENISGFQVRFQKTSEGLLYCNLLGSETEMNGQCQLLLSLTKSQLEAANGVWAGIGFGSSNMLKLDMVIFNFWKTPPTGTSNFKVSDSWSTATSRDVYIDSDLGKDSRFDSISN